MLRLACVLLYQGRFKSHRSWGSRISLRVRSTLVTFCIYLCSSCIIIVLCAILCSFSTSNSLVFAFSQFACVCMFVCVLCIEQGEAFQTRLKHNFLAALPCRLDISSDNLEGSSYIVSVPRLHCKVLQKIETEHCFFLLLTMQSGLIQ